MEKNTVQIVFIASLGMTVKFSPIYKAVQVQSTWNDCFVCEKKLVCNLIIND